MPGNKLYSVKNSGKKPSKKKYGVIAGVVVLALIALIVGLEVTNTTYLFHKRKAVSGPIPTSNVIDGGNKDRPSGSSSTSSSNSPSPIDNAKTTTPTNANGDLAAPYGTFVSNHNPSLSNPSSAPSGEASTCITVPGASCTITFTSGGVTKTLDAQTADSRGAVYWNWDVKTAGFTEGNWTITATATLNGQSKSTKDSLELKVSP